MSTWAFSSVTAGLKAQDSMCACKSQRKGPAPAGPAGNAYSISSQLTALGSGCGPCLASVDYLNVKLLQAASALAIHSLNQD